VSLQFRNIWTENESKFNITKFIFKKYISKYENSGRILEEQLLEIQKIFEFDDSCNLKLSKSNLFAFDNPAKTKNFMDVELKKY
jgi:hypothetical protein